MSNLVERLENCSRYNSAVDPREMCLEAASAITRLTEEVERLRLERDEAIDAKRREHVLHVENVASATARAEAAEKLVEELRGLIHFYLHPLRPTKPYNGG